MCKSVEKVLISRKVVKESMKQLLENNRLIIMEAAIVEQLRRSEHIFLHPGLLNAALIYDRTGRQELTNLYQNYISIASAEKKPFLMCTPTWRANKSRVYEANVSHSINQDASHFMQELRNAQQCSRALIKIGGMIGCKNDCYQPGESLNASESEKFHSWQIDQLAQAGVDFLIAQTLPATEEAIGIAKAMAATGLPYIISFVINRDACVLDGSRLINAIDLIDVKTSSNPVGYMVNCAYPSFLCAAEQPLELFDRLIGYQANASSLDQCDLDNAQQLQAESVAAWGEKMLELNHTYGIKILGGCCGTGDEHLRYIVNNT